MNKSFLSGALIISIGLIFLLLSFSYNFGDLENLGPGFFPRIVSIFTIVCGTLVIFSKND